jgi:hypothetical protein
MPAETTSLKKVRPAARTPSGENMVNCDPRKNRGDGKRAIAKRAVCRIENAQKSEWRGTPAKNPGSTNMLVKVFLNCHENFRSNENSDPKICN